MDLLSVDVLGLTIGGWYYSKRGHLCRVESIMSPDRILVTSHFSGNKIVVSGHEIEFLKPAPKPTTPPGTAVIPRSKEVVEDYSETYAKYPNVVAGSIYKVEAKFKPTECAPELVKIAGKLRIKKQEADKSPKGSTRCKIKCQKCNGERDIKVQDLFQVKYCDNCQKKNRQENLKKFLHKKKSKKHAKAK